MNTNCHATLIEVLFSSPPRLNAKNNSFGLARLIYGVSCSDKAARKSVFWFSHHYLATHCWSAWTRVQVAPRVSGMTYLWLAYSYSKHPIVTGNAFPLSNEFFSCLEYKLMSIHKVVWNGTPIWSSFTDVLQGMQVREHLCRCAFFRQVYVSYFCTNPS